jgi:type I restriction enzyme S subunit
MKALICGGRVTPEYLARALQALSSKLLQTVRGTTADNISTDVLRSLEVPIPPLCEQMRIGAILERADRLRRLRQFAVAQGKSVLSSVFLDLFGDFDREPTRWKRMGFDELCLISDDTVDPKSPEHADLPQISSEDIESVSGDLGRLRSARQKGIISVNFLVRPDEILFSKIRPRLRKVAYPKSTVLCSADIYPIRVVHPACDANYLLFYFRSDHFSAIVTRLAEARCNIPKVNRDELSEQTIPIPPLLLQRKFASFVKRVDALRSVHGELLRQAEHLFQTLLHRAFTSGI